MRDRSGAGKAAVRGVAPDHRKRQRKDRFTQAALYGLVPTATAGAIVPVSRRTIDHGGFLKRAGEQCEVIGMSAQVHTRLLELGIRTECSVDQVAAEFSDKEIRILMS